MYRTGVTTKKLRYLSNWDWSAQVPSSCCCTTCPRCWRAWRPATTCGWATWAPSTPGSTPRRPPPPGQAVAVPRPLRPPAASTRTTPTTATHRTTAPPSFRRILLNRYGSPTHRSMHCLSGTVLYTPLSCSPPFRSFLACFSPLFFFPNLDFAATPE